MVLLLLRYMLENCIGAYIFLILRYLIRLIVCSSLIIPNVVTDNTCVCPLVNSALPCTRGNRSISHDNGLISSIFLPSTLFYAHRISCLLRIFSLIYILLLLFVVCFLQMLLLQIFCIGI